MKKLFLTVLMLASCNSYTMDKPDATAPLLPKTAEMKDDSEEHRNISQPTSINSSTTQNTPERNNRADHNSCNLDCSGCAVGCLALAFCCAHFH